MKISIINYSENSGGAGRAAHRLFEGLKKDDSNFVKMFVKDKTSNDSDVVSKERNYIHYFYERYFNDVQEKIIRKNRTNLSNTIMSYPFYGYNLLTDAFIKESDIINLHWVNMFQSVETIEALINSGKSVVWTLHDEWAYTGGCHYSAGCKKYETDCFNCPLLTKDPKYMDLILKAKVKAFNDNITIITPSKWLGARAKDSVLFRNSRVEVIPNSIDTELFKDTNKKKAKDSLNIESDSVTILFGAENHREKRKGFEKLLAAMEYATRDNRIRSLISSGKINIITFGNPNDDIKSLNIQVRSMGYVRDDKKLALIYSASDFVVLPSIEDNLPNVILEAMACGTPILGFKVGGLPDIINDEVGKVVTPFDTKELGEQIIQHIVDKKMLKYKQKKSRKIIEMDYTLKHQADSYVKLFQEVITENKKRLSNNNSLIVKEISAQYFIKSSIISSKLYRKIARVSKIKVILSLLKKTFKYFKKFC